MKILFSLFKNKKFLKRLALFLVLFFLWEDTTSMKKLLIVSLSMIRLFNAYFITISPSGKWKSARN